MCSNPLISIIIPAYNTASCIAKTVDSILKQAYQNYEVIIVDDGSEDDTAQIVDEIARNNPEKVRAFHVKNSGVTKARLTGVSYARGEWIGFVDSDDTIEPDMYEILINNAIKYSADISHCGYKMMFEDGRVHYFHNTQELLEHDTNTALKELLSGRKVEPGLCNKLFRKEHFEKLINSNQMDYSIKINEDLLMNFILFSYSEKSVFYDVCKYNYIVRQGSASRSTLNDNKVYDPIKVKEHILRIAPKEIEEAAIKAYVGTCVNTYNTIMLSKDNRYDANLNKIRRRIKESKEHLKLLNRKTRILALMILNVPKAYKIFYGFYSRGFQEKKYE